MLTPVAPLAGITPLTVGGVESVPRVANNENTKLLVVAGGNVAGQVPNGTGAVLYAPCPAGPGLYRMLLTDAVRPFVLNINQ